jgi:cephalosporin hydroxylase
MIRAEQLRAAVETLRLGGLGAFAAFNITRGALGHGALQKRWELTRLVALVRARRPRVVVEIGVARGGTFWAWCRSAAPDALLIGIDQRDSERPIDSYALPTQTVSLLMGDSHDPELEARVRAELAGRQIDFLMIDGDHSYEGVIADYLTFAPLVAANGLIALHDIIFYPTAPGIERLWRDLKISHRHLEFTDRTHSAGWGGIGVILDP